MPEVLALVPHPQRQAVLVSDDRRQLPSVTVDDDDVPKRLDALSKKHGIDSPFLRRVGEYTDGDNEYAIKEFETLRPQGRQWLDFDDIEQLEIVDLLRPAIHQWVRYQQGQPYPLFRPAWARPGWYAQTREWLAGQLHELGITPVEEPKIVQQWAISSVLRQPTAQHGDYYLKSVFGSPGRAFWHEPALSHALHREHPGQVPQIAAIDSQRGIMVMPDMAVSEFDSRPQETWSRALPVLARIQRHWVGRSEELRALGCPDRDPARLPEQIIDALADERFCAKGTASHRERVTALLPDIRRLCDGVADWPVPLSLGHGDFHAGNVGSHTDGSVRIFDWSDGAWTHPFLDVAHYTRRMPPKLRDEAWQTYLECWSDYAPVPRLRELIDSASVLNSLYQVITYQGIIDNVDPNDAFAFSGFTDVCWERILQVWDSQA